MDTQSDNQADGRGRNVGRSVFWGFALVAFYFLYTEHRAHLFAALPYLLLAACPLMHLFHHHGGHGHQHGGGGGGQGGQPGPGRGQPGGSATSKRQHH